MRTYDARYHISVITQLSLPETELYHNVMMNPISGDETLLDELRHLFSFQSTERLYFYPFLRSNLLPLLCTYAHSKHSALFLLLYQFPML